MEHLPYSNINPFSLYVFYSDVNSFITVFQMEGVTYESPELEALPFEDITDYSTSLPDTCDTASARDDDLVSLLTTSYISTWGWNPMKIFSVIIALGVMKLLIKTLRPRQNGRHSADDILKYIFLN